jgi:hypothetical protein
MKIYGENDSLYHHCREKAPVGPCGIQGPMITYKKQF